MILVAAVIVRRLSLSLTINEAQAGYARLRYVVWKPRR